MSPEESALVGRPYVSPEEIAEADRVAEQKRQVRAQLLGGLMENEDFRDWLWGMLALMGTFGYPLANASGLPDPMATQFYLGRKSAGEDLWRFFDDLTPDLASKMRREHAAQQPAVRARPPPRPPARAPQRPPAPAEPRLVGEGVPGEDDDGPASFV